MLVELLADRDYLAAQLTEARRALALWEARMKALIDDAGAAKKHRRALPPHIRRPH